MKQHLNTLFVTTQGAYLFKEGEALAVKVEGEVRLRVPIHTLDGVVCFGQVSASPFLLGHCAENHGCSFESFPVALRARAQIETSCNACRIAESIVALRARAQIETCLPSRIAAKPG